MTLIVHLVHKDYQVVAADGKLTGVVQEYFRKVIAYPNGFLYYMGEIAGTGNFGLHEWITTELPLTCAIGSVEEIKQMLIAVRKRAVRELSSEPQFCVGFGGLIARDEVSRLVQFDGADCILQTSRAFVSKKELEVCYNEAYRKTYGQSGKLLVPDKFGRTDMRLLDCFFADAVGCRGSAADFNVSLNVGIVRMGECEWLREDNDVVRT